ncbi:MAG: M1 family metallopeptidase [Chloroflexota bacterium]
MLLLSACQSVEALPPTATTLRVIQATIVPTVDRALHAVASAAPGVPPTPDECQASAALPTTQHRVRAEINYETHRIAVAQVIRTINRGSETLNQIVLDVEPNRFSGIFTLDILETDHGALGYELTARRLTIDLETPFAPGCALEIDLNFTLRVPLIGEGINSYGGYLGYTANQMNLGQWLPVVAVRRSGEWVTHDVSVIGEQTVAEVADWDVDLTVSDIAEGMRVAAPGTLREAEANRWRYKLSSTREFTLSLSPHYEVLSAVTESGVEVEVYSFAQRSVQMEAGQVNSSQQALDAAVQSLTMYGDLFGAFSYDRFVVVQGDFPDGMEFSGIVFVSDQWFRSNTGTPQSYLTIITVHETAHQWWYARVGSDQALNPWLDEALATYSEYIFYEEYYPDLKTWWWNFRVDTFVPADYLGHPVGSGVYEFGTVREYINAVYLRGAQMLDDLREEVGTDAFFDWLRRYAEAGQNRIVTPDAFWSLLTSEQLDVTRETRVKFLGAGRT